MIKIVASIDDCGNKKTKQFSTAKNRDITMDDVSKLEDWIKEATKNHHLVQISYKVTFDTDVERRYNHTILGIGYKTRIRNMYTVHNTIQNIVNEINNQVRR